MINSKNIFSLRDHNDVKISFGNDPDKDWVTLCVISFLLFLSIIFWSLFIFLSSKDDALGQNIYGNSASSTPAVKLINTKVLSDLLGRYDQKQKDFDSLKSVKLDVRDPSL